MSSRQKRHDPAHSGPTGHDVRLAARVAHALRYPFDPPHRAYMFRNGRMDPLDRPDLSGRHAVVASGSNGSAERLTEKFGTDAEVPVTYGTLHDLVPVFAARITRYGSVPATLGVVPGARAGVHVTWLTDAQLAVMHASESVGTGYGWYRLDGFRFDPDGPHDHDAPLHAYLALFGTLAPQGRPLPLHEVPQHTAQHHVKQAHGHQGDLEHFIGRNLTDEDHRQAANRSAASLSGPIDHPGLVRLL